MCSCPKLCPLWNEWWKNPEPGWCSADCCWLLSELKLNLYPFKKDDVYFKNKVAGVFLTPASSWRGARVTLICAPWPRLLPRRGSEGVSYWWSHRGRSGCRHIHSSLVQLESCFQVFLEGPGAARCVLEYLMLVIISLQTLAPLGTSDTSFTLIDFSLPEVIDWQWSWKQEEVQYCLLLQDFKLKLHVLNESPRVVYHEELVFYCSLSLIIRRREGHSDPSTI